MYSRGMLAHEYGVDLKSIHWHQGGVNQAGRVENVNLELPGWLRLTRVSDRSWPALSTPRLATWMLWPN